jgi:hypothetical protein
MSHFKNYIMTSGFGRSTKLNDFLKILEDDAESKSEDIAQGALMSPTLNNLYKVRGESAFSMDMPSIILARKRHIPDVIPASSNISANLMVEMTYLSGIPRPVQLQGPWFSLLLDNDLKDVVAEGIISYQPSIDISGLNEFSSLNVLKHMLLTVEQPFILESVVVKSWNGSTRRPGRPVVAILVNKDLKRHHNIDHIEVVLGIEERVSRVVLGKDPISLSIMRITYQRTLNPISDQL